MLKIPATVGILTYNSAGTLKQALESVQEFDDIVICDGGSTDTTLDIARAFGARIIPQHPEFKNADNTLRDYSGVRNQLLSSATYDWFLYIDSDETVSEGLRTEIRAATTASVPLVYRVPIGIMMDGRYLKHSSNYPGFQHRFFNRLSGARFIRSVHERIEFASGTRVGTFVHPWYIHTTREEWSHYLKSNARYRTLEAANAAREPLGVFVPGVFWQLRISLATLLKTLWLRVRYGGRDSVPWQGEMARAVTPLVLIAEALRLRFSRPTDGSRYSSK